MTGFAITFFLSICMWILRTPLHRTQPFLSFCRLLTENETAAFDCQASISRENNCFAWTFMVVYSSCHLLILVTFYDTQRMRYSSSSLHIFGQVKHVRWVHGRYVSGQWVHVMPCFPIVLQCNLIHQLYPTNHHWSQELGIFWTPCFLLHFLKPATCLFWNLESSNLTWPPLLLAFHFLPLLGLFISHRSFTPKQLTQ